MLYKLVTYLKGGYISLLKIRPRKGLRYLIFSYGIGDTVLACTLLLEYMKANCGEFELIAKYSHQDILNMFPFKNKIVYLNNDQIKALEFFSTRNYMYKRYYKLIHPYECIKNPMNLLGLKTLSLFDIYRSCVFNLGAGVSICKPKSEKNIEDYSDKTYDNTILLIPYANSVDNLNNNFWIILTRELTKIGYKVFTSISSNNEAVIEGSEKIQLSLEEISYLSNRFTKIVALRNGLCDLLAFFTSNLIVLYSSQIVFKQYNLKNMGIFDQNILENVVEQNAESIKYIVNKCKVN